MPDWLKTTSASTEGSPWGLLFRLVTALLLGMLVAWIYRRARKGDILAASFPTTLVLLSVLIAMVTQVIGDNIARAFSLVGALSIVRFRTVVRDTQDTAYVLFAVVVGMAVGANNFWVAIMGIAVGGIASFSMFVWRPRLFIDDQPWQLSLRLSVGHDVEALLGGILDSHVLERRLLSAGTARQGIAMDFTYQARLRPGASAPELIKALNRVEGVQSVQFGRRDFEET